MGWSWLALLICCLTSQLAFSDRNISYGLHAGQDVLGDDNFALLQRDGDDTKYILEEVDPLKEDYQNKDEDQLADPKRKQVCYERDTSYIPNAWYAVRRINNIESFERCSKLCASSSWCRAWKYASMEFHPRSYRKACFLIKGRYRHYRKKGMIAGKKSCQPRKETNRDTVISRSISEATTNFNRAYKRTEDDLKKPPQSAADLIFRSRYPSEEAKKITKCANIFELGYKYSKHGLNTALSQKDIAKLFKLSECQDHKREVKCSDRKDVDKYRSSDGTCNNLNKPEQGASMTSFSRALPSQYVDGLSEPVGWRNTGIPSARKISLDVLAIPKDEADDSLTLTHMFMQFGQFLDHDLGLTAEEEVRRRFSDGEPCLPSCENEEPCFPIQLPKGDKRRNANRKCMEFVRTPPACGTGYLKPREQLNELTSYIDASNVYGSEEEEAKELRDFENDKGLLRVGKMLKNGKFLLPLDNKKVTPCMRPEGTKRPPCFLAGDRRVNEQVGIIPMHTIWLRQHNRLTTELRKLNPHWDGETTYQEARKIVGAQMQHIVYTEWLPKVIGPKGMQELGEYKGYNPSVDASVLNSFTTAALRFGHTTIQPSLARLDANFKEIPEGNLPLHQAFFAPQNIQEVGDIDVVLRGLFGTPAQQEKGLNTELTERLFELNREMARGIGLDLATLNIQRGRDHGLPSYNHWRQFCGLPKARNFNDLRSEIKSYYVRHMLEELYKDVDKVDLFAAGVLEDIVKGARVGPIFLCLIRTQFQRLRDGDRFYYENPGVFSSEQLQQIKKTTLAKIICENGDNIQRVQPDVFLRATYGNQYTHCSKIPQVDLKPWREGSKDKACWRHVPRGCVNGHNLRTYRRKSVEECKSLCLNNPRCKAFEYGVNHGGNGYRCNDGPCRPRDCRLQSGTDSRHCYGGSINLDLYVIRDCNACWRHVPRGCVNGHNLRTYRSKSIEECKSLCLNNPRCKAFEYGVNHGGNGYRCNDGPCKPRDCRLQSGTDSRHCYGGSINLDLYVIRDCNACWRHVPRGCVSGHNLKTYRSKSIKECKSLCLNNPRCKAFEYGVNHGGNGYRCNDGPCRPRDCRLQSGTDSRHCYGGSINLDLYIIRKCDACWRHVPRGCVSGHNLKTYRSKSIKECKSLCLNNPRCKAFEYGVNYEGNGYRCNDGPCKPRDCRLQSGTDSRHCYGGSINLDLYVIRDCQSHQIW